MLDKKEITKEIPRGVKWILILYGIYLAFIVFGIVVASKGASSLGFAIILIISLAIISFFIVIIEGFRKAKNWARILVIIIAFFSLLNGIIKFDATTFFDIFIGIILIIINGLVAAYLIFNKEAKDFFRVRK